MSEVTRDPEGVATELAGKLSPRRRHVCVLLGAGASRSAGLPDLSGLQDAVKESSRLTETQQKQVAELFKTRNLEEVLSYLRRLLAILGDGQSLGDFNSTSAKELQTAITSAIIPALDHTQPPPASPSAISPAGSQGRTIASQSRSSRSTMISCLKPGLKNWLYRISTDLLAYSVASSAQNWWTPSIPRNKRMPFQPPSSDSGSFMVR